jgi:hypothetical protein
MLKNRKLKSRSPFLVLAVLAACSVSANADQAGLTKYYTDYPFFLEALATTTDRDFDAKLEPKKAAARKQKIEEQFEKNPDAVRKCLREILRSSSAGDTVEDKQFITYRMSEIAAIVRGKSQTNGEDKGSRD